MVVLAGVAVSLFLAEGIVRITQPHARDHVIPFGLIGIDPVLGWKLQPGYAGRQRTRSFDVEYRTNDLGFRDRPRAAARPPGIYRVLLYGDSQVFGWGIPMEARFSNLLENHLSGVEIWNRAVPGYALDQMALAYLSRPDTEPADEAVFYLSGIVLARTRYSQLYRKPKPRYVLGPESGLLLEPVATRKAWLSDGLYRLVGASYLTHFGERLAAAWFKVSVTGGPAPASHAAAAREPEFTELHRRILLSVGEAARRRGERLTIMTRLPEADAETVRQFCGEQGRGYLNADIGRSGLDVVLSEHDRHWNEYANRLAFETLAAQWADRFDPERSP
jgi:hypothetical protein